MTRYQVKCDVDTYKCDVTLKLSPSPLSHSSFVYFLTLLYLSITSNCLFPSTLILWQRPTHEKLIHRVLCYPYCYETLLTLKKVEKHTSTTDGNFLKNSRFIALAMIGLCLHDANVKCVFRTTSMMMETVLTHFNALGVNYALDETQIVFCKNFIEWHTTNSNNHNIPPIAHWPQIASPFLILYSDRCLDTHQSACHSCHHPFYIYFFKIYIALFLAYGRAFLAHFYEGILLDVFYVIFWKSN